MLFSFSILLLGRKMYGPPHTSDYKQLEKVPWKLGTSNYANALCAFTGQL